MLLAFYKPYDVLSQFTRELPSHRTLADFGFPPQVYPLGRLDRDSEGLLLLSDEAHYNELLLHPRQAHPRTYHAQVEGVVTEAALDKLRQGGLDIQGHRTLPCKVKPLYPEPAHPERVPPIRQRKSIPTTWLDLTLTEGKNRQVRRMTAAVGHPTLRLIRVAVGGLSLNSMALRPGEWIRLDAGQTRLVMERPRRRG